MSYPQTHFKYRGRLNRAFWRRERENQSSYAGYVHGPTWNGARIVYRHIPADLITDERVRDLRAPKKARTK